MTAQTPAQRQQAFKASQREAGMVRLDIWLTKEQRDKLTALGGVTWLRKKIDAAKLNELHKQLAKIKETK